MKAKFLLFAIIGFFGLPAYLVLAQSSDGFSSRLYENLWKWNEVYSKPSKEREERAEELGLFIPLPNYVLRAKPSQKKDRQMLALENSALVNEITRLGLPIGKIDYIKNHAELTITPDISRVFDDFSCDELRYYYKHFNAPYFKNLFTVPTLYQITGLKIVEAMEARINEDCNDDFSLPTLTPQQEIALYNQILIKDYSDILNFNLKKKDKINTKTLSKELSCKQLEIGLRDLLSDKNHLRSAIRNKVWLDLKTVFKESALNKNCDIANRRVKRYVYEYPYY